MRDAQRCGAVSLLESFAGFLQQLLVAKAGDESAPLLQAPTRSDGIDDGAPQFSEPLAGERGNAQCTGHLLSRRQVALVSSDKALPLLLRLFDQLHVLGSKWRGQIHYYHGQVGIGHGLMGALDAESLCDV